MKIACKISNFLDFSNLKEIPIPTHRRHRPFKNSDTAFENSRKLAKSLLVSKKKKKTVDSRELGENKNIYASFPSTITTAVFNTIVSSASSNSIFFNRLTTVGVLSSSQEKEEERRQKKKKKWKKERKRNEGERERERNSDVKRFRRERETSTRIQREFASHRSRGDKSGLYQGVQ